jgi:hypothetical protein
METTQIKTRVDDSELEVITHQARTLGFVASSSGNVNLSAYLKFKLLNNQSRPILFDGFEALTNTYAELNRIGININQITAVLNEDKYWKDEIPKVHHLPVITREEYEELLDCMKITNAYISDIKKQQIELKETIEKLDSKRGKIS